MCVIERLMYGLLERENDGWVSSYIGDLRTGHNTIALTLPQTALVQIPTDHDNIRELSCIYVFGVCGTNIRILFNPCFWFCVIM